MSFLVWWSFAQSSLMLPWPLPGPSCKMSCTPASASKAAMECPRWAFTREQLWLYSCCHSFCYPQAENSLAKVGGHREPTGCSLELLGMTGAGQEGSCCRDGWRYLRGTTAENQERIRKIVACGPASTACAYHGLSTAEKAPGLPALLHPWRKSSSSEEQQWMQLFSSWPFYHQPGNTKNTTTEIRAWRSLL